VAIHLEFTTLIRGPGQVFGRDVFDQFLTRNGLTHMVRSHQLCFDGFQIIFDKKLSTIWSAPNYCYKCGNIACILEISEDMKRYYNTFVEAPDSERIKLPPETVKEVPDYYL